MNNSSVETHPANKKEKNISLKENQNNCVEGTFKYMPKMPLFGMVEDTGLLLCQIS